MLGRNNFVWTSDDVREFSDAQILRNNIVHNCAVVNQRYGGDRFISRRDQTVDARKPLPFQTSILAKKNLPTNILEQNPKNWRKNNYVTVLNSTLNVQSRNILDFSVNKDRKRKRHKSCPVGESFPVKQQSGCIPIWPCYPRKRPCIEAPICVYDLPMYYEFQGEVPILDLVDWSNKNFLTAGLGNELVIMEELSNDIITHKFSGAGQIMCVKSNPEGNLIAFTSMFGITRIIDVSVLKIVEQISCPCLHDTECQVQSFAWSPTGHMFAIGCFEGWVYTYTKDTKCRNKRQVHGAAVIYLNISPDSRYLATSGDDMVIKVLMWPTLQPYLEVQYEEPATAISWHPWKSALLAIGTASRCVDENWGRDRQALIELWNIPSRERLERINLTGGKLVDCIAFNDITGEMIISICIDEYDQKSSVLVLSNFVKVVDTIINHGGRLKTLLFNPDHTKIACAATTENLFVWNYFGDIKRTSRKRKKKSLWTIPLALATSKGEYC